jgi:E3 ubiquitin-protein ligase HECTD1
MFVQTYTIAYRAAGPDDELPEPGRSAKVPWTIAFVEEHVGTETLPKTKVVQFLQRQGQSAWLQQWKLEGELKSITKSRNRTVLIAAYKDFVAVQNGKQESTPPPVSKATEPASAQDRLVQLIQLLHELAIHTTVPTNDMAVSPPASATGTSTGSAMFPLRLQLSGGVFQSAKITAKLQQQLQDSVALATGAFPPWCTELPAVCPALIPFETRRQLFQGTSFGVSRSIAWLQTQQGAAERMRQGGARRPDNGESQQDIGRLTSEKAVVPRHDKFFEWAVNILRVHAPRKSVLDVEFTGEPVHDKLIFSASLKLTYHGLGNWAGSHARVF